jgi:hypothetical protein
MLRSAFYFLLPLWLLAGTAAAKPDRVYLFPTLHRLHQENPHYSYESLQTVLRRIRPDLIAVEIRAEDLSADTPYLRLNYPYEMWMMRYWFPEARIAGFDWLGEDIAGSPIPPDYWKEKALIKKLQRALQSDSLQSAGIAVCDTALPERMRLLKGLSLQGLIRSAYGPLTERYYSCLEQKLGTTRYRYITDFYSLRNHAIIQNCLGIIRSNPGKSIVILTGADHYPYVRKALARKGIRLSDPE